MEKHTSPSSQHLAMGILNPDGSINRKILGQRVFADPEQLDRLNALVHPQIRARAHALRDAFAIEHPGGILVTEAAIMIETGSYKEYDRVIVAACRPEQQIERAVSRGLSRARRPRTHWPPNADRRETKVRRFRRGYIRHYGEYSGANAPSIHRVTEFNAMRLNTLLLAAILVGGFVWYTSREPRREEVAGNAPLWTGPSVAHSAGLSPDEVNNIDIYKAAQPSVAYITSTVIEEDYFFGPRAMQGIGSGFIISPEGQILTNNHVVSGSSELEVSLPDKSKYKAQIITRMPSNDLALIKIDPQGQEVAGAEARRFRRPAGRSEGACDWQSVRIFRNADHRHH